MKSLRSLKTGLGLLGLLCALSGANYARADLSYLIDINTASIVNNAAGPFYLDFQSNYGSGASQTVTLSNFSFTGGSLLGSGNTIGAVSGDLGSSLVLSPSSGSFLNEFYQQFASTVSDIKFTVNLTTNVAGATPTSFSVALLDSNVSNIPTPGVGDSLVLFNINDGSTNFQTATSTGATGGVTPLVSAIPEPSTYGLMAGVAALAAVIWRRRVVSRARPEKR